MTIQNLTNETFAQEIQRSTPILVDFWAPWCGYCRRIGPALEKVAQQSQHSSVAKLNIDEFPEIAEREGVEVIPTLILYRDGKVLAEGDYHNCRDHEFIGTVSIFGDLSRIQRGVKLVFQDFAQCIIREAVFIQKRKDRS